MLHLRFQFHFVSRVDILRHVTAFNFNYVIQLFIVYGFGRNRKKKKRIFIFNIFFFHIFSLYSSIFICHLLLGACLNFVVLFVHLFDIFFHFVCVYACVYYFDWFVYVCVNYKIYKNSVAERASEKKKYIGTTNYYCWFRLVLMSVVHSFSMQIPY